MSAPAPGPVGRLSYIDWMRGLAILIMIEAHVLDAWTRPTDRQTLAFAISALSSMAIRGLLISADHWRIPRRLNAWKGTATPWTPMG